jgi:hypothetical protein
MLLIQQNNPFFDKSCIWRSFNFRNQIMSASVGANYNPLKSNTFEDFLIRLYFQITIQVVYEDKFNFDQK